MNQKFDALKQTLTNIEQARLKESSGATPAVGPPLSGTVTKGRTTLNLSKNRGSMERTTPAPASIPVTAVPTAAPPPAPAKIDPPDRSPAPPEPYHDAAHEADVSEPAAAPTPPEPTILASNLPDVFDVAAEPPPTQRTEMAAALRVKAQPKTPKPEPLPNDKILTAYRLPYHLCQTFAKICKAQGKTKSKVLQNLIEDYCGLCLFFALTAAAMLSPVLAQPKDSSFTTEQILAYLQSKAFGGLTSHIPNIRGTANARQTIWQTGASDPIDDFVYADYSNTRLEAKIEIPIFDLSYLRNRDKEKLEHRTFVMKALSKILAAQKAVSLLETRIGTVRQRRDYMNTQVNLKLANRSDLFAIEDNLFSLQSQLFEAQSTLEQRVLELATLAENDWQKAYWMIIKWDGVLIDPATKGGKKK